MFSGRGANPAPTIFASHVCVVCDRNLSTAIIDRVFNINSPDSLDIIDFGLG
jgi:hypothetical protein